MKNEYEIYNEIRLRSKSDIIRVFNTPLKKYYTQEDLDRLKNILKARFPDINPGVQFAVHNEIEKGFKEFLEESNE